MNQTLFADERRSIPIAPGAMLLEGFALEDEAAILEAIEDVTKHAPFRHMVAPNGYGMSVGMTNCGKVGWVSDRTGYRYDRCDPETGNPWPEMPDVFMALAKNAAAEAGYLGFVPDACLMNLYEPGAKLSLHCDNNEEDYTAPIVSISLGLLATFLFGGLTRQGKTKKITLHHGDVVVFGGESRLCFHGIAPLKNDYHHLLGTKRINLTFRKAL